MAIANQLKLQLRRYLPASVHERMTRTYRLIKGKQVQPAGHLVPNHLLAPPPELSFVGDGDFHAVGTEFLALFTRLAGLQPVHRVLDVGCGVGRMAVPLLDFLSAEGSYDGFDVVPAAVDWCRQNISTRNPKFRFQLADIRNEYYYSAGTLAAEDYRFPYADRSFDLVILTSVFTHLMPAATANYLKQIRRVLKPDGRCFITWFVINDESRRLIAEGKSALHLVHPHAGILTTNPSAPEEAVGFDEERVRAMYEDAGLTLRSPMNFGKWCGKPDGATFQDVAVACRPDAFSDLKSELRQLSNRLRLSATMRRSLQQRARNLLKPADLHSWATQLSDDEWFKAIDITSDPLNPEHPDIPGVPSPETQVRFTGRSGTENLRQAFNFYRFCLRSMSADGSIGDSGRILDFGCGWGRIARFWLREADPARIWCVDAMAEAVDLLRATGMRAHALQCSPVPPIEGLPERFRLIYAFSVFSHLSEPVALRWLEYFADRLEPGGCFIFTTRGKQYLAYLRHLRVHPPEDEHQTRLMAVAPSQHEIESRYAAGEFVFFGTGGGGELTDDFYGEAIISEAWLRITPRLGFSSCVLQENVPGIDQAVVILRKM